MGSSLLFWAYGAVMVASLACFLQTYRLRRRTPVHMRWGWLGTALAVGGVLVVIAATYGFGLRVEQRYPLVVLWHRRLALVATALVVFVALSGWRRWRVHTRLYVVFLPVYAATVALALVGYRP